MLAVNYSTLRNNLKGYCDRATDENETVIVTRKEEKNVVIKSRPKHHLFEQNRKVASRLGRGQDVHVHH